MVDLKKHYDKYDSEEISIEDRVMARINERKPKKASKYILLLAAVVMLMGAATMVIREFTGPDGQVVWRLQVDESLSHNSRVEEIRDTQVLDQGDILMVYVKKDNPEDIVVSSQEPWLAGYEEAKGYSSTLFGMPLKKTYGDFNFFEAHLTSLNNEETTDNYEKLRKQMIDHDEIIVNQKGDKTLVSSVSHIFKNEEKELIISFSPWHGQDMFVNTNDHQKSISVHGYEGLVKVYDKHSTFVLIKDGTYYAVAYPNQTFDDSSLIELLEEIFTW